MNNVQPFREELKLSQKALAELARCSQPTIAAIEAGGTTNVQLAQRIAVALNKPIDAVFPPAIVEQKPDTTEAA